MPGLCIYCGSQTDGQVRRCDWCNKKIKRIVSSVLKGPDRERRIPRLGETDGVPFDSKTVYQRWTEPQTGFYWLIAEYDPRDDTAFGYANLADDDNAEWGYIQMSEIRRIGAVMDRSWRPVPFAEASR